MEKMKLNIQLFGATCTVSVKSITQDIVTNSSTIVIHGKLATDKYSWNNGGAYMQPTISNQPIVGSQTSSQTLTKKKYNLSKSDSDESNWTFTVYHYDNGTCNNLTISIAWYVSDSTKGTKTLTNGYTPAPIPRASSVSASDGTLNQSLTINIDRKDSSFTHALRYVCGNDSGNIADSSHRVGTSVDWTPSLNLAWQNKEGNSVLCTIYCQTYNGNGQPIGTEQYTTITLTIPSLPPTATLGTVTDSTTYKSTYGAFIQNKSTIKVSLSGTPQYTDISSYSWEIRQTDSSGSLLKSDSGSYTGSLDISYTPTVSGTLYIKGTVIDKRGASDSTDITVSVTAYSPPTCSLTVSRVNSTSASYTMSGNGTTISNAGYTANTLEFKLVRGSTTVRSTSDGTSYTGTDTIADQSYTYTLTAKDTISGTIDTKTVTISTTFTLMNFNASGKAMAIGKASEAGANEELFEIGMNTNINGIETIKPPVNEYSALDIHSSNKNEASIAYYNQARTFRYVAGYGTASFDGFGIYSDETTRNVATFDKDGNAAFANSVKTSNYYLGNDNLTSILGNLVGHYSYQADMNNALSPGIYNYYKETLNKPSNFATYGMYFVVKTDAWLYQIAFANWGTPRIATRVSVDNGSTWTSWDNMGDTGWQSLATTSDFESYSWGQLQYRNLNGVVSIVGVLKVLNTTAWNTLVATLPAGSRPPIEYNVVCRTSKWEVIKAYVNNRGELHILDLINGTYLNPGDSLEISITYIAGA